MWESDRWNKDHLFFLIEDLHAVWITNRAKKKINSAIDFPKILYHNQDLITKSKSWSALYYTGISFVWGKLCSAVNLCNSWCLQHFVDSKVLGTIWKSACWKGWNSNTIHRSLINRLSCTNSRNYKINCLRWHSMEWPTPSSGTLWLGLTSLDSNNDHVCYIYNVHVHKKRKTCQKGNLHCFRNARLCKNQTKY